MPQWFRAMAHRRSRGQGLLNIFKAFGTLNDTSTGLDYHAE